MDPRPGLGRGGGLDRLCDRVCLLRYQTPIRGVSRALFLVATPHYFYYYNPLITWVVIADPLCSFVPWSQINQNLWLATSLDTNQHNQAWTWLKNCCGCYFYQVEGPDNSSQSLISHLRLSPGWRGCRSWWARTLTTSWATSGRGRRRRRARAPVTAILWVFISIFFLFSAGDIVLCWFYFWGHFGCIEWWEWVVMWPQPASDPFRLRPQSFLLQSFATINNTTIFSYSLICTR